MRRFLLCIVLCLPALPLFAWGEKGHYLVAEAATATLPTDMPAFFYKAFPELIWLAYDPDRLRNAGPSIDAVNPPDHFLDYEYVADLQLPADRYKYVALLESSGTLRRYGIDNATPGFLPWRIAEMSEQLQSEWRQWRTSRPGSPERAFIERDIIHVAGVLGHFAGDSSNPQHTTINFNGWITPNPNGYANDCDVHSRFETQFVSHAIEAKDVTPKVAAPRLRGDYFATAIEMVRRSNAMVEPLYRIDRYGGFDLFRRPPSPQAVAFTSERIAAGAALLRDLWWSAWKSSEKPVKKKVSED
ncbi:MAG TPA: hypothetical protein VJ276_10070 [Thermoanaerobaculia bacterium]|nr:hypothetical protein [Thermoanaerobaculia bacterium]